MRPKQREARIEQSLLRPRRDDDIVGVDWTPPRQHRQMTRRGGTQVENAGVGGVVGLALLNRPDGPVRHDARRVKIRLPRRKVDDVFARGPTAARLLGDRQGRGRLEPSDIA